MKNKSGNRTQELSRFLAGLEFEAIPPSTLERAKELILDHLGVAVHSHALAWTRIVRTYALECGGRPESTIYGCATKVGRGVAALANGTAGYAAGLDDAHTASFGHPGAVVVPTALAVAEARDASARELLTAVVAGYEALGRVGVAATAALSRGFHPTAVIGMFGAAAAAARLTALNPQQFESALGLALSTTSGVMQFTEDSDASMVKHLHGGLPAQNGAMVAQLVASGFRGPQGALDGKFGYINVFAGSGDESALTDGLGERWVVDEMSVKTYACCLFFHAALDAFAECREAAGFSAEDVASVEVMTTETAMVGRLNYRPESVTAAQYSWPYAMATAMLSDAQDPRCFDPDNVGKPGWATFMDQVKVSADPQLEQYFPVKFPGAVRITLKDGQTFERRRLDASGTPEHPVNRQGIEAKFRKLTDGLRTKAWQDQVVGHVFDLGSGAALAPLMAALRVDH